MYTSLIENTHLAAAIVFLIALGYLVLGLFSPSLVRAAGRGRVVLRSVLGVFLALVLYVGVIVYTHMQPDGPHSVQGYINSHDWEQYRVQEAPAEPSTATETPGGAPANR